MNKQKKIYNNVEGSPEDSKIMELTRKELAEDRIDLIIKSLESQSEKNSSFFLRKFLLKS